MSTTTLSSAVPTTAEEEDGLSETEWIVIVVVLVIILIVLIIAIAKCLEFGKSPAAKSLIQNDEQSMRSETLRSTTGTRSLASTRSRPKSMKKLPLNAEITRFSAGRVSRSAEYGVVIKDIKKTVQESDPNAGGPLHHTSPPPSYHEQVNTLNTYRRDDTLPAMPTQHTLSSPPTGNLIVNEQYATYGLAPPNSKAVFVAPDEIYATPRKNQPMVANSGMMVRAPTVDRSFPLLTQPAVIMQ